MSDYCTLVSPDTVRVERDLPGPIERVWAFLTDPAKRKTWMADGIIEPAVGGSVHHIFRNAELTGPAQGEVDEHRIQGAVLAWEPPRLLSYTWEGDSEVTFELAPAGERVHLVVTHRRIADPDALLAYSAGWHAHLDLLADRLAERTPPHFDTAMARLRAEYATRINN